ncbi:hypothetical protein [Paraburkholderia tropica]|uniref:hypothetical protein n=1 Tax=Paraburkholderia tropica TaxID=92647 RepID=UPI002AAF190E|nr:hypothetical protein [Paraburkholderia tropica]
MLEATRRIIRFSLPHTGGREANFTDKTTKNGDVTMSFAMRGIFAFSVAIVAGCASNSGVVPIGKDTFMVSRQAATGFSGLGDLKAKAYQQAAQYCLANGKSLQPVHTNESQPPYVLGNFPRVELEFMCLSESDPQLGRPKFQKDPDTVIQLQK